MLLSVCLITADPASRIAAILEPLRPFADEVVIAADSRVDEDTLAAYRALADKLFRIEYCMAERHLAWLCSQCEGDWILRLDGDEVPSAAFVRRLPQMLASRRVRHFWTSQAWLYPDADQILADAPWSGDFHVRLIRNDSGLRAPGVQHLHIDPVGMREYVAEPFYHLDLLLSSEEERRDKTIRYEVARPRLRAAGGGRINEAFYMPELRSSLGLRPVPSEDRGSIARALSQTDACEPSAIALAHEPGDVPFVGLREMDRLWEQRSVSEDAYKATIEPHEQEPVLAPAEERALFFSVTNEGSERWPADLDERPLLRLAYRWLKPDGSVHTPEGLRSPFPRRVSPGERVLTPLHVLAPTTPGDYVLEVDVVHEHVRWFGRPCRMAVSVQCAVGLPSTGIRLCETPTPRLKRWRRMQVPRVIHRVWLGAEPMPAPRERFGKAFADRHPGWQLRLWTDADLAVLDISDSERERARSACELSNLMRYEILRRFGGVYLDADVECLRDLTPLLRGVEAFAALELPGLIGTAILGAVPGHRVFERAARLGRKTLGIGEQSVAANGPYMLSLILEQEPGVTIFGAELLCRRTAHPDCAMGHSYFDINL